MAAPRKHRASAFGPQIPLAPFQQWINEYMRREELFAEEMAWRLGCTERTLYRIRHGISGHKPGRRVDTWARFLVEDYLARAGADFYDVYPEFAHERDVDLEPDAWCEGCREVTTPIDGVCPWCESLLTKWQEREAA